MDRPIKEAAVTRARAGNDKETISTLRHTIETLEGEIGFQQDLRRHLREEKANTEKPTAARTPDEHTDDTPAFDGPPDHFKMD